MARYTWKAISATISIFSAVLVFQGVNGILEAYLLEDASVQARLIVTLVHMLAWFFSLQVVLAVITGVLPVSGFDPKKDDLKVMEARMKTFAILLGHITGFAAINFFATVQQQVPRTFISTFLVAPVAWAFLYLMGRATDAVRERVVLMNDGKKDEVEALWDEEAEETEDDVVGLATSFVFAQSVRLLVGGTLPNAEGEEPLSVMREHTLMDASKLVAIGCGLAMLEVLRVMYVKAQFKRLTPQLKNIIAMNFSWCGYFGLDWMCSCTIFGHEEGMMKQVTLALVVTGCALADLYILEHLHELRMGKLQETVEQGIRVVVNSIGILIGFAWEKAFDVAVVEISETVKVVPPQWTKLALSVSLVALVVPAWYRHILPTILELETDSESEGHSEHHKEENVEEGHLSRPLLNGMPKEENGDLKKTCESLRRQVAELERSAANARALEEKNRELEAAIVAISRELGDLQQLADASNSNDAVPRHRRRRRPSGQCPLQGRPGRPEWCVGSVAGKAGNTLNLN
eukprot:CAMPEP_0177304678 /NCGR_PEP_ID=MMETSP0368-20130122/6779_1 /TAXON_ID=447022 ORGANISM="Scrippsiella hangoei-like, Strain SHHI-4" /NCGR_SAMPLE_ID=MMETSP0368 /ASSEMBLY_ACC=CAM_ASM_000363 /LENGTH=517 /DNA_ID=CAMNT_0018763277 /DNA_START=96 /DNA_END=1647 /DNA_ORIENTATION=-